jgi:hypothetical protein
MKLKSIGFAKSKASVYDLGHIIEVVSPVDMLFPTLVIYDRKLSKVFLTNYLFYGNP